MELEIDGDDSSPTSAVVSELQLLIEGAAVEEVDRITSDDHFFELERCCGGWGVPRWPASGQAGPRAHVELSRGRAVVARDILEAFKAARVGTACSLWPFVGEACMSAQDSGTCLHVSATRAAAVTTMCCRVVVGCV